MFSSYFIYKMISVCSAYLINSGVYTVTALLVDNFISFT